MANTGNNPNFIQNTRRNSPLGPDSPPQKEKGTFGTQDIQELGEKNDQANDRGEIPKPSDDTPITEGTRQR
jgi:hypothetical protein